MPKLWKIKCRQLWKIVYRLQLDEKYWSNVFHSCIQPYLNTIRDVNRVINTFQLRYKMLYQETAFEDMIAITTIEVLEPELYKWIRSNKDIVCGTDMHHILHNGNNKPDYKKMYIEDFKKIGVDPTKALDCVATLFPIFSSDISGMGNVLFDNSDVRGKMRAAYSERFDLYFMSDLDDIKVSRLTVNACIYNFNEEELKNVFNNINEQGNISFLFEEIRSLLDSIPSERLRIIATAIMSFQGEIIGEKVTSFLPISSRNLAEFLVEKLIRAMKYENERYDAIKVAIERATMENIGMIARLINTIELAYGRLAGDALKSNDQLVTKSHLDELERVYANKMQQYANDENLFDMSDLNFTFYLWECFDEAAATSFINEAFKDEMNKLRFVCAVAGKWNGSDGNGWAFYPQYYSKYLSDESIADLIEKKEANIVKSFTDEEQIKLASFVLNRQKSHADYVTEREAKKLVNDWKKNYLEKKANWSYVNK